MHSQSGLHGAGWVVAVLAGMLCLPAMAPAQTTGTVRGKVTSASNKRPLAGAQVMVPGTGRGSLTNSVGDFLLVGIPAGSQVVRVQMLGYGTAEKSVNITEGQASVIDFELNESAISLDEVVVTGTAGATEKRKIGNTIATVNASEVMRNAPVATFDELLKGRAAGVNVLPASGSVGTGAQIRVRGMVSISQDNSPLIYVDGVRIDDNREDGLSLGGQGLSRLADLNPADFERVEVIKGAAATTLYGTEASAGVIQIFTKQGAQGAPQWTFQMEQGLERIPDVLQGTLYDEFVGPGGVRAREAGEIIETGHHQAYRLSVGGGGEGMRYYIGGSLQRQQGSVVPDRNHLGQVSMRANLTALPTSDISINLNTGYANTKIRIPDGDNALYGMLTNIALAVPYTATEERPWGESFNPTAANRQVENLQGVHHFTGGLTVDYEQRESLRHAVTVGLDLVSQEDTKLFPFGFLGSGYPTGRRDNQHRTATNLSVDYRSVLSHAFSPNLTTETAIGGQINHNSDLRVSGQGLVFPAPGVSTVGAAARTTADETRITENNAGVFAQETLGLWDKLFVTGGIRMDGNSAFGDDFRTQLYPKASVAYSISEESFWPVGFWPSMKLRAAWGTSGLAPAQFAADRTYLAVAALEGQPAVTPDNLGDPDLAPEKSTELELGFDAGFLEDRFGLVVTYFRQKTTDALVPAQFPPSAGFLTPQLKNIGEVRNEGLETQIRALWITRDNFQLESDLQMSLQRNEVTDMGGSAPILRHVVNNLQVREGYPVSSFWTKRLVGWDPVARNHIVTDTTEFMGSDAPKFFGSFTTRVGLFNNLSISGMADWATGHFRSNTTRMFRIQYRTGDEYLALVEKPTGARTPASDSLSNYVSRMGNGAYIEPADFLKLREVALTYSLPASWLERFGMRNASVRISGRNLYTLTKYTGFDPETSWNGADSFNSGAEFFTVPPARRFVVGFSTSF